MTTKTSIFLLAALLVLTLSALAVTLTSNVAMCASCHEMRPFVETHANSTHADASCYDCHMSGGWWGFPAQKASEFFGMYPAHFSRETTEGIQGPSTLIQPQQCLECHSAVMDRVVESNGPRIRHSTCAAPPTSCSVCHSAVVHGTATRWISEPIMEDCILCHTENNAPLECHTCHADKTKAERLSRGPWAVTHGPQWRTTHGAGDLRTCITCHAEARCVKCHATPIPHPRGFYNTHGEEAQNDDAACLGCHDQATFCDSCHGMEMPHADGFIAEHSEVAQSRQDAACLAICHNETDCAACHAKHVHPGATDGTLQDRLREAQGVSE